MRRKCERGRGNINADGAGAEVFAGDGCSQGASFIPMAAISQRGQGGRIIIIRVRASRCGESALNSPPSQPIPRRRSAPAPAQRRALPEPSRHVPAAPTTARRPHDPFPVEDLLPPRAFSHPLPSTSTPPRSADAHPPTSQHISRRRPSPCPSTFSPPSRTLPLPTQPRRTPADLTTHSSPKAVTRPRTATRSSRTLSHPLPAPTHTRRLRRRTPTDLTTHSPPKTFARPRSAALPPPPFRFGHKKTAPHSACAMPNVSVDRRCGRSLGLVSRALFAAVTGRWRVGVGLRPQPWALRSRRCGRVLRA